MLPNSDGLQVFEQLSRMPPDEIRDVFRCSLGKLRLSLFVRGAWAVHHGETPMLWNWHIDCICDHLEAVLRGEIQFLYINVPPGFLKSLLVSVYFPAWVWTQRPGYQFLCTGAADQVVYRDARRHMEIVESEWYQRVFMPQWKWLPTQAAKGYFVNTEGGHRISRTVRQLMTGLRGDCRIMDDPNDASHAANSAQLAETNFWTEHTFLSRKNDHSDPLILVQQRLNEWETTGFMLGLRFNNSVHLTLANEYNPARFFSTATINPATGEVWADPRDGEKWNPETGEGELLHEARVSRDNTNQEKKNEIIYKAQWMQDPTPAGGNIFKRDAFKTWVLEETDETRERGAVKKPKAYDFLVASCDFNNLKASKATRDTDYAVIDLWGVLGADRYLEKQIREKVGLAASIQLVKELPDHFPGLALILIEKKANGPSVISAVKALWLIPDDDDSFVKGINVQGEDKQQRAIACLPIIAGGRVYVPDPNEYGDMEYWYSEVCGFPGRRRDDRVDTMTMALLELEKVYESQVWSLNLAGKAAE